MTYPKFLNLKLFQRLVNQRKEAGKPMSVATQKLAIAKLRKMVKTGQNQEKILLRAIEGDMRVLKDSNKQTKPPVLPGKPKNLDVMNKEMVAMREALS